MRARGSAARPGAPKDARAEPEPLHERVELEACADGQRLALAEVRPADRDPAAGKVAFLLLHGFAQNRTGFSLGPMPRALVERGARVFLGELRGHGDSRVDPSAEWSLRTHLELDLPALLEGVRRRAGVQRVHLVGHSMGGLLGCALLAADPPLASLTLAATPLVLGAARPLVRLAALTLGPFAAVAPRGHRVPMHHFLRALSGPLSRPEPGVPLRLLQRVTRLANPGAAPPAALEAILARADPESPAVFRELAANAVRLRPRLAGVDLVAALRGAQMPVAAIAGSADIFAPRASIAPLERGRHAGPRRVVEIPGGTHVDATMGYHVPETMASLWDFLLGAEPAGRSRRRGRS